MIDVGIVIGSTRLGRKAEPVARWVYERARQRRDARFELVDLATYALPLDKPGQPPGGQSGEQAMKRWSAKIAALDAFVFVTPEYNPRKPFVLKNALALLGAEWNDKAAGFVAYGSAGGARAVEHLRGYVAELQLADVRARVAFHLQSDFENFATFKPSGPHHEEALAAMLDQLVRWGTAMKTLRSA